MLKRGESIVVFLLLVIGLSSTVYSADLLCGVRWGTWPTSVDYCDSCNVGGCLTHTDPARGRYCNGGAMDNPGTTSTTCVVTWNIDCPEAGVYSYYGWSSNTDHSHSSFIGSYRCDCAAGTVCDNTDHCIGETWYDGYSCTTLGRCTTQYGAHDKDDASAYCTSTASGCTARAWLTGGEAAAFGQYNTGTSTECCGDDGSENARTGTAVLSGGSSRCCNLATDCVDASSACVPSGTYRDAAGVHYVCSAGTWAPVGCYLDSHCGTCQTCNLGTNTCVAATAPEGNGCTGECTSCISGTCTNRAADDTTEGCSANCQDCVSGTCQSVTQDNDGTCNDDCTSCVSGTCTNRAQCASNECAAGTYCHIAGGDCTNPDTNTANAETTCEAECGGAGSWYHTFTGDPNNWDTGTTASCCGDDAIESFHTRVCSAGICTSNATDTSCCNAASSCVYSTTCYVSGTNQDVDSDGYNEYCDAGTWTGVPVGGNCDQGGDCGTGNCVDTDATCGGAATCQNPASSFDGRCCSDDTNPWTADGIITRNAAGTWDCDETQGSLYTSDYYGACADTAYGVQCDSNALAGGYLLNGVCGGAGHASCYTDYASDSSASITASSQFGTMGQVCDTESGWQCDSVADGSFVPGNKRCDSSDLSCRTCNPATREDDELLCELGCTADAWCDERARGYEDLGNDQCCANICQMIDCDIYDDNDGSDAVLNESETTAALCSSGCSGQSCCARQTHPCFATNECRRWYDLITNEDETTNQYCFYTNAGAWRWNNAPELTETACRDFHDNDCDGECDYDEQTCSHGDSDCPVAVTQLRANDTNPCIGSNFLANCTISPAIANSLELYVDQNSNGRQDPGEGCSWLGWGGLNGQFICSSGAEGIKDVICYVNDTSSYQSGINQTLSISVGGDRPVVTLYYPPDGHRITNFWESYYFKFNYSVTDVNEDVFDCDLLINGSVVDSMSSVNDGAVNDMPRTLSSGSYSWQVRCDDGSPCDSIGYSELRHLVIDVPETIMISPLGETGFMGVSECTNSRVVALNLAFDASSTMCSYSNDAPSGWSTPEPCTTIRLWSLNDIPGARTVFYRIEHSTGTTVIKNDTIEYQPSGSCLDLTEPSSPIIVDDGDYTADDTRLHAYWYGAFDPEAALLKIPLQYEYMVNDSLGNVVVGWTLSGTDTQADITGLALNQRMYYFNVRVRNSNSLTSTSSSDGILVDTVDPSSSILNDPPQDTWRNNNSVTMRWTSIDGGSGIAGASVAMDGDAATVPDRIIDTTTSYKDYVLGDGRHHFHLVSIDRAGNAGTAMHHGSIGIDTKAPTKPVVQTPTFSATADSHMIIWSESLDLPASAASGIDSYHMTLRDLTSGTILAEQNVGNVLRYNATGLVPGHNYAAQVVAIDRAGMNSSTETFDVTPPTILSVKPAGLIGNKPAIIVRTDEKATCTYDGKEFMFTNSTMHETLGEFSPGGPYTVQIACSDMGGLEARAQTIFTYTTALPTMLSIAPHKDAYVGVEFSLGLTTAPAIGELRKDQLSIMIDGRETDFSLVDLGGGSYKVSFEPEEAGDFMLTAAIRGGPSANTPLSIGYLRIEGGYYGELTGPIQKERIVYAGAPESVFGFGSDSRNISVQSGANSIRISAAGRIYLFKTSSLLPGKEKDLDKPFLEKVNAFGYPAQKSYMVGSHVNYKRIIFSDILVMPEGDYEVMIVNKGLQGDDIVLEIRSTR